MRAGSPSAMLVEFSKVNWASGKLLFRLLTSDMSLSLNSPTATLMSSTQGDPLVIGYSNIS